MFPGRFRELKIDLLLECVHFSHLHFDVIAEAKDAAGAPAYEMISRRIEHVKIVLQTGERHEAAHAESRNVDEQTEVADFGDQCGIALWLV
jgi:hypothetical protein